MTPRFPGLLLAVSLAAAAPALPGQAAAPPPKIVSPEVHPDGSVTFRLRAPGAKEVLLDREFATAAAPMGRGADGVWELTTPPLEPDFYGYNFRVDGVSLVDPANTATKPSVTSLSSLVRVPSAHGLPWEEADVPHGALHRHLYRSGVVGDLRDYFVYTPPGYDPAARRRYPVLCLLHGYSDDARAWPEIGRVPAILDNLIAAGKARPMIVVMPLGYGVPETRIQAHKFTLESPEGQEQVVRPFRRTLLEEVLPRVERDYRTLPGRENRAIAGNSMGGMESLLIGLNDRERFAWIGSLSAGGLPEDFGADFPTLDAHSGPQPRLIWIACGVDDRLLPLNRRIRAWLRRKGFAPTELETPGGHGWPVWRRNLASLLPLLFGGSGK